MITIKDRVRFVETDLMAVVHHANYLRWFEMGRVAYLRAAGVALNDLMAAGYIFPITDVSCKYKNSAKFDDEFEIRTKLTNFTKAKMCFSYDIVRCADKVLLAQGKTQNVFTNMEGRITRLPESFFQKINALYSQENEE
jgi:acyl-CoA thioester hydrolase